MTDNYIRFKRKLRDILATSKAKCETKVAETRTIPLIKQSDTAKLLPKYSILVKNGEEGVSMDDLDSLQEDLEKLLNNSAIRIRYLLTEVIEFEGSDDDSDRKANDKTLSKKKRLEEKPKSKEQKNGIRFVKKFAEEPNPLQEPPEVSRNITSDKFWASVDPYCADIGKEEIVFLDTLIQSISKEINLTIPELGAHYAKEWEEEVLNEEQNLTKPPSRKLPNSTNEIQKFGVQNIVDTVGNPVTQRLLAALLEEKVMEVLPKGSENGEKKTASADLPPIPMNNGSTQRLSVCLDNLLKKELVEMGILLPEDLDKTVPDDEIVVEIKKCQQELLTMNDYCLQELKKLKELATNDLQANQIKEQLDKVDNQVLELYHKISTAREAAQKEEGEEFDKVLFSEQITREFETQTDVLLSRQIELTRQLNGVTDMQMLY